MIRHACKLESSWQHEAAGVAWLERGKHELAHAQVSRQLATLRQTVGLATSRVFLYSSATQRDGGVTTET